MRPPSFALAAFVAALLIFAAHASAADYVPGRVIVKYRDHAPKVVRAVVQRRTHTSFDARLASGARALRIRGDRSVPDTIAALKQHPNVQYAVPDYIAHASYSPNDPGFARTPGGWGTRWRVGASSSR